MREIMFFSAIIGLMALAAPQFLTQMSKNRDAPGSRQIRATKAAPAKVKRTRARSRGTVEIQAARNGHFLVNADVNLSPVRFVVDTGASFVALRQSDAESAGIYLSERDFKLPVSTANGTAYAASIQLETVGIEGIDIDGVRAIVLPDSRLGISLLGNSFLNRLQSFRVSDNRLVMEN